MLGLACPGISHMLGIYLLPKPRVSSNTHSTPSHKPAPFQGICVTSVQLLLQLLGAGPLVAAGRPSTGSKGRFEESRRRDEDRPGKAACGKGICVGVLPVTPHLFPSQIDTSATKAGAGPKSSFPMRVFWVSCWLNCAARPLCG